jgi:hypothetical protein
VSSHGRMCMSSRQGFAIFARKGFIGSNALDGVHTGSILPLITALHGDCTMNVCGVISQPCLPLGHWAKFAVHACLSWFASSCFMPEYQQVCSQAGCLGEFSLWVGAVVVGRASVAASGSSKPPDDGDPSMQQGQILFLQCTVSHTAHVSHPSIPHLCSCDVTMPFMDIHSSILVRGRFFLHSYFSGSWIPTVQHARRLSVLLRALHCDP